MIGRVLIPVASLCMSLPSGAAEFAGVFGDRMVLQRDQPIAMWGTAAPGEVVSVTLSDAVRSAEADASGRWQVGLPAMRAGGPHEVTLRSSDGPDGVVRTLSDVLVGDLWLCSGQSNMAHPVAHSTGSDDDPATFDGRIRLLTVERDSAALPRADFAPVPEWRIADAHSIPEFSGVCFFFARELAKTQPVPLGLIHSSWGGAAIEAWMSAGALEEVGGFDAPPCG